MGCIIHSTPFRRGTLTMISCESVRDADGFLRNHFIFLYTPRPWMSKRRYRRLRHKNGGK